MYCTLEDILQVMDEKLVAQLSNDANPQQIDVSIVQIFIEQNSTLINGYLRGRYPLPLKGDLQLIRQIAVDLVKFDLYSRRDKISDRLSELRKECLSKLEKIQKGIITLEVKDGEQPIPIRYTEHPPIFEDMLIGYRNML